MCIRIYVEIFVIWNYLNYFRCQEAPCQIPDFLRGDFYSLDTGDELNTRISADRVSNQLFDAACYRCTHVNGTADGDGHYDVMLILFNELADCYQCFSLRHRTTNVLQYQQSSCQKVSDQNLADDVCQYIPPNSDFITQFRISLNTVNCKAMLEGIYHFTYEIDYGGGSVCDNERSLITACQEPGSVYVDNQVFYMQFASCDDVVGSVDTYIRFQCMGTWKGSNGNVYAAIADLSRDRYRERFKCLLTRPDQELMNQQRYTMSRWASCLDLKSPYEGPIRLILSPALANLGSIHQDCLLPENYTGTWYKGGEYDTNVVINSTHIYFSTFYSQYSTRETYFVCQQNKDNRYLMKVVNVGRCEVDYVCYDFLPRHHNIIRWRLSKATPSFLFPDSSPDSLEQAFRHVCAWSSFTFDRDDTTWAYSYFIMIPPAPIVCPIGGRYSFEQYGDDAELYKTRVRGVTDRPRHQIDCLDYTSEFKSCDSRPNQIYLDAEYCNSLDHTGKPIGEYDVPDRQMICAGFWQEDMKSFLITYDTEDIMSTVRCWVYERTDWRTIVMSRASSPVCSSSQTAWSKDYLDYVSLNLVLTESERIYDSCPQRYDTGANPWTNVSQIFLVNSSSRCRNFFDLTMLLLTILKCICSQIRK